MSEKTRGFIPPGEWSLPVLQLATPGMRTLELGATNAATAYRLAGRGVDACVADRDPAVLTRFPLPAYAFDPLGEWPNQHFDLVYSIGLLQRYEDAEVVHILKECASRSALVVHMQPNSRCTAYQDWKRQCEADGTWRFGSEHPRETLRHLYAAAQLEVVDEYSVGRNFPVNDGEHYLLVSVGRSQRGRRPSISMIQRFWRDGECGNLTAAATLREADRLELLGYRVQVIFINDGQDAAVPGSANSLLQGRRNSVWIANRDPRGAAASLNQALATATGDYLLLLDGCVGILAGSERLLDHLQDHPESHCLVVALGSEQNQAARLGAELPEVLLIERLNRREGSYSEAMLREANPALYLVCPSWPARRLGFRFEQNGTLSGAATPWHSAQLLSQFAGTLETEVHVVRNAGAFYHPANRSAHFPWWAREKQADYYHLQQFNITAP